MSNYLDQIKEATEGNQQIKLRSALVAREIFPSIVKDLMDRKVEYARRGLVDSANMCLSSVVGLLEHAVAKLYPELKLRPNIKYTELGTIIGSLSLSPSRGRGKLGEVLSGNYSNVDCYYLYEIIDYNKVIEHLDMGLRLIGFSNPPRRYTCGAGAVVA